MKPPPAVREPESYSRVRTHLPHLEKCTSNLKQRYMHCGRSKHTQLSDSEQRERRKERVSH